jgi:predicted NBD/HSP70 family sugar kinase
MDSGARDIYVGIDFGGTKLFGALVGSDGRCLDETYVEHRGPAVLPAQAGSSPEEAALGTAYAALFQLASTLVEKARARGLTCAGVGIGAPGIVAPDGVVVVAGSLGWRNAPLGPLLQKRLDVPVRVENDLNLAALGEHAVGAGRGCNSMFLLAVGTGIGGASIIDGRLWRGKHNAAGEIGGLLPGPEFLDWHDRDWGAFEAYASGTGLSREAAKAAAAVGETPAPEALKGERLFAAAAEGVPWARKVVDRAVALWTVAIGAVQVVLDPDVIVLSGGVAGSAARYLPDIAARLSAALPQAPAVVASTLGYRAGVLGTAALFGAG